MKVPLEQAETRVVTTRTYKSLTYNEATKSVKVEDESHGERHIPLVSLVMAYDIYMLSMYGYLP